MKRSSWLPIAALPQAAVAFLLPDDTRQPVFTLYAWNEFGEGGFVAPTHGGGCMKLEAVREVFGIRPSSTETPFSTVRK